MTLDPDPLTVSPDDPILPHPEYARGFHDGWTDRDDIGGGWFWRGVVVGFVACLVLTAVWR